MNDLAKRVGRELRIEFALLTRRTLLNVVAGSNLVPRPLRWLIYRACGMAVHTPNVFPGLEIAGQPRNLTVGTGTFVNTGCFFELVGEVSIGRDCQLGMQTMVVTSHHESTAAGISRRPVGLPVRVGDRVWAGARVTILPGVTIADDVVLAAGAVVTADCVEPGVYAGVPARLVRSSVQAGVR